MVYEKLLMENFETSRAQNCFHKCNKLIISNLDVNLI